MCPHYRARGICLSNLPLTNAEDLEPITNNYKHPFATLQGEKRWQVTLFSLMNLKCCIRSFNVILNVCCKCLIRCVITCVIKSKLLCLLSCTLVLAAFFRKSARETSLAKASLGSFPPIAIAPKNSNLKAAVDFCRASRVFFHAQI